MKTQTTYSDKSLLTISLCFVILIFNKLFSTVLLCILFFNSYLPQQVCSASRSVILFFLNRSALRHVLLSFCSSSTLPVICSVSDIHFISFCTSIELDPQHILLSPFLLFRSFFPTEQPPHTVSLVFFYTSCLDSSTSPLLWQEQRQLSKQLNRHLKR